MHYGVEGKVSHELQGCEICRTKTNNLSHLTKFPPAFPSVPVLPPSTVVSEEESDGLFKRFGVKVQETISQQVMLTNESLGLSLLPAHVEDFELFVFVQFVDSQYSWVDGGVAMRRR